MTPKCPEGWRLLDLFCGAGGAAMGYFRAGFTDITGIDNKPMPRYPFKFIQTDALEYLAEHGSEYDIIHASPPCQGYSRLRHLPWLKGKEYPLLIPETRRLLQETGKIYVIENVSDAPLWGAELCGAALGLPLRRHRRFEINKMILFPSCPGHPVMKSGGSEMATRYKGSGIVGTFREINRESIAGHGKRGDRDKWQRIMGIDWMTMAELTQAVPPAYTEYIGRRIIEVHNAQV